MMYNVFLVVLLIVLLLVVDTLVVKVYNVRFLLALRVYIGAFRVAGSFQLPFSP